MVEQVPYSPSHMAAAVAWWTRAVPGSLLGILAPHLPLLGVERVLALFKAEIWELPLSIETMLRTDLLWACAGQWLCSPPPCWWGDPSSPSTAWACGLCLSAYWLPGDEFWGLGGMELLPRESMDKTTVHVGKEWILRNTQQQGHYTCK